MPGKFEDKWEDGCWLGIMIRTGEHLVVTARGVFRVSTVRRKAADSRWSRSIIDVIGGSPEIPIPGLSGRNILAYARKFEADPEEPTQFRPTPEPEQEVRPVYIYKSDIEKHGPSAGCPGCRAIVSGGRFRAKHNSECRKRLEAEIGRSEEGGKRIQKADENGTCHRRQVRRSYGTQWGTARWRRYSDDRANWRRSSKFEYENSG